MVVNFKKDNKFFAYSNTFKTIEKEVQEQIANYNLDSILVDRSIKLWVESVIKHNLDINMMRVDHLNLLSEENSKEVLQTFGSIMFKDKHDKTEKDRKILMIQGQIANTISLIAFNHYDKNDDIFQNLKDEYISFKELKSTPKISK